MTTEQTTTMLEKVRTHQHPHCVVCGLSNPIGLKLDFVHGDGDCVQANFFCHESLQGYEGYLHGGVAASLLDGAMANCMFSHGSAMVTAELNVRYLSPVQTGLSATVRAWIHKSLPLLNILHAEIVQGDKVKATATGKFMVHPGA